MNWKFLVAVVGLGVVACGKPPDQSGDGELCTNSIDDDGDGLVDCADPDCAQVAACQVNSQCAKQKDCFGTNDYDDYLNNPMPLCVGAMTCETPAASIDILFRVARPGYSTRKVGAVSARFIKKTAVDGSAVTCAQLEELATSRDAADAGQIERTGRFNLQAWNVFPVTGSEQQSTTELLLYGFSVSTGADFIIWTELWSGAPNSNTGLPTGIRWNHVCVESGPEVAEIKPEHHYADPPSATSRFIKVSVPDPLPAP